MITYNNPKDTERRSNVDPLSSKEMEYSKYFLNNIFAIFEMHLEKNPTGTKENYNKEYDLIQRIFDYHANLQHFHDNAGGWEGLAKLQETADNKGWISVDERLPEAIERTTGINGISDEVTVFLEGKIHTGVYSHNINSWVVGGYGGYQHPTHWQPLPEPPTE